MPRKIDRLDEIASAFDVLLCDVWGVVHNGINPFPQAIEALVAARRAGKTVVMITNSPRPAEGVIGQFAAIGVDAEAWDDIVTSGDVTRSLVENAPRKLFYIGPERDRALVDGLDVELVDEDQAEAVLCTGPFHDETETPDDYAAMLSRFKARDLPFYCANPDQVVERGERIIYCAGALGSAYEAIGGVTRIAGKPHRPIYDEAIRRVEALRGETAKARMLAVGDGMGTDIRGAVDAGLDALFIARGIHAADYYQGNRVDEDRLATFFEHHRSALPTYWSEGLSWGK
ncbi:TIGR01459 family HAD-type hydrolase [Pseudohoeflea coraliihabitans]|uniref:TIGR01459 family HAD-type hydrolase n=1 Tax=Pseudohoeflea coraliihabitans TaxID=2860393 RepID=A0ABS6WMC5_9HYPH|nr:TIGR01459 family HAD-type hydrolase [Pseudohoeflea sp. DP4N28-3]MBW3097103.1 TIGR01459 family HAD-type hydrolase [Pseudohoeflea sp. DP4N28-3]